MKKITALLVLSLLFQIGNSQFLDQTSWNYDNPASNSGHKNLYPGETQSQSFTAGMTGNLDSIVLAFNPNGNKDTLRFKLEIFEGEGPTGNKLASKSDSLISPYNFTFFCFKFSTPLKMVCGNIYTMKLSCTTLNRFNPPTWVMAGTFYPRGKLYLNSDLDVDYVQSKYVNTFRTYVANATDTIVSVTNGHGCGSASVALSANAASCDINWYAASTGGSPLATAATFNTPVISTTTTYYVATKALPNKRKAVVATINSLQNTGLTFNGVTLMAKLNGATYQWLDYNRNPVANETNQSFTPSISGLYSLKVSKNGCVDTSVAVPVNVVMSWKSIDAGDGSVLAIMNDGSMWAWGSNAYGQLGDGTQNDQSIPVMIGNDKNWKQVSNCAFSALALKTDSTLWAWGDNFYGQLGDGTFDSKLSPVKVGSDKWIYISAGSFSSFGIKADGTLWAWGENADGQFNYINSPLKVDNSKWIAVSAGDSHFLGIKSDSTLWARGDNSNGQLGDGTFNPSQTPILISSAKWKSISAGNQYNMAIKSDGTLWTWGFNYFGQLGNGASMVSENTPAKVGLDKTWIAIKASQNNHSLAIKSDHSLWAWGYNGSGQLGDGTKDDALSPKKIGNDSWSSITAGTGFSVGINKSGSFCATGLNTVGQLGNGTKLDTSRYACSGNVGCVSPDVSTVLSATTISANQAGAYYQWIDCANGNAAIKSQNQKTFTIPANGSYAVVVYLNGCLDTSACVTINNLGTEQIVGNQQVLVYPNPTAGIFTVASSNEIPTSISVVDIAGRLVLSVNPTNSASALNLQEFSDGVYFIKVQMMQGTEIMKILLQR